MKTFKDMRLHFEATTRVAESVLLVFKGLEGRDVYNCSVPFTFKGKKYIYGRVERRGEWVESRVRLFEETGKDEFTLVPDQLTYELEDPFIANINGEFVFGGVQVIKDRGSVCNYYCDFLRGTPDRFALFTSGPDRMKDIRLVALASGEIGIFSHHKTESSCLTGFITIKDLNELTDKVVLDAAPIDHGPFLDAWGGVNQAYLLDSGKVGCISHHGYLDKDKNGVQLNVYCITSFVYEPSTNMVHDFKVIGTKGCYPPCEPKAPKVADCAFVSGIVMRDDGKCDLYSGLGDTHEGRMVIDYPFEGHGLLTNNMSF